MVGIKCVIRVTNKQTDRQTEKVRDIRTEGKVKSARRKQLTTEYISDFVIVFLGGPMFVKIEYCDLSLIITLVQ